MTSAAKLSFLEDTQQYQTVPIIQRFFVDTLTPIQLFQQLKDDAVFLLESKDEQSSWSRYSFVGLNPYAYLKEENSIHHFTDAEGKTILSRDDFRSAFQDAVQYLNVKPIDTPIPFSGGAVGCIAYDGITQIEPIEQHRNNDLQLKQFSFMFCETILAFDHQDKELHVIHHIRMSGKETKEETENIYDHALQKIDTIMKRMNSEQTAQNLFHLPSVDEEVSFEHVNSNYKKEKYLKDVDQIKEYIRQGDIFQAVLSQRFEIDIQVSGLDIYRVLRVINPSPYLFYVKIDGVEVVGSSPERLVEVQHRKVEIHPIAGTRKRGKDEMEDEALAEDLKSDEKERAEHFMLVDLARNDVGRVAKYGTVHTPVLMEVGRFSHVMHLISKVVGDLADDIDPIDALLASFPAGTVSGAPKIRAMEILQELEPTARNFYAGALGYLGFDGNIDSCIAIRTIFIKDNTAYIQAGAGIVADSVPENEWQETRNKAKALIKAVDVAEKIFSSPKEHSAATSDSTKMY